MCSNISWIQFLVALLVLDVCYYFYVVVAYFRKDIFHRLRSSKQPPAPKMDRPAESSAGPKDLFPQVQALVDEIRALLEGAGTGKADLLEKLRLLLQKYPALRGSPFQATINQLITVEAKTHSGLALEQGDLESLWTTDQPPQEIAHRYPVQETQVRQNG
jgi:hypothetical protein